MTNNNNTAKEAVKALAYLRTSSAANVGADRDSDKRQAEAIARFADRSGYAVVGTYYDAAVSGADPLDARPGFAAMLERIAGNGVRVILVETANRFARDLLIGEIGYARLRELGITLIACDSPNAFVEDTPTGILIRQILGAVAQFDKAMTVAKLRGARDRKSAAMGRRIEGRKGNAERLPEVVALARRLYRKNAKTGKRRSMREIAAELAVAGHVNERGRPYHPQSVADMLAG